MTNETVNKKRVRRDRREEILQEATNIFSTYGYRGATLAAVAEAVDLTEPGLLHYFPSKAHLLQGVLEYRDQQDEKKYSKLIDADNLDLREIFRLIEDLVAQNEEVPGLVQLFTVLVGESINNEHPSHSYFVKRYERARKVFLEFFTNLRDIEIPSNADIEQLSILIIAVMDGLQIQWLLDPNSVNMSETFNFFSKIVLEYLNR